MNVVVNAADADLFKFKFYWSHLISYTVLHAVKCFHGDDVVDVDVVVDVDADVVNTFVDVNVDDVVC